MTLAEMRAGRERGESKSDFDSIRRNALAGIEPATDDDAPDMSEAMRAEVKRLRGRPAGSDRTQIALRVDNATLEAFKATGKGWQSRMNAALAEWVKSHSPA
ncbi:MAG: BrnA antitoxin family protein [Sulfurisoma sp.]|nr:BrnA antitoxin family protein [Sulfurisoma sp.]